MFDEFKRLHVWLILSLAILTFFPIYWIMDNADAIDVIASFCAVVALGVEWFYGPAFIKLLKREAGEMTENYHFLLLGILIVAFSTAGTRIYGLWWRVWGKYMGFTVDGWFPAFMAWLAFVGYMNHIIAPRQNSEGVPIGNRNRVVIVLCLGAIIGLWFSVYN